MVHQNNTRATQRALLAQQRAHLTQTYDPVPPPPEPRARAENVGLTEMAKDRWNAEVERLVRWGNNVEWDEVREQMEVGVGRVWNKLQAAKEPAGEGIVPKELKDGVNSEEVEVVVTPVEKSRWSFGKSS